jgi:hypothetical protein
MSKFLKSFARFIENILHVWHFATVVEKILYELSPPPAIVDYGYAVNPLGADTPVNAEQRTSFRF